MKRKSIEQVAESSSCIEGPIEKTITASDIKYGIIHIRKRDREFFPGYRVQFVLHTDLKPFVMHLTGGYFGLRQGSNSGQYICHPRVNQVMENLAESTPDATDSEKGSFKRFYSAHQEVRKKTKVRISKVNDKEYSLEVL